MTWLGMLKAIPGLEQLWRVATPSASGPKGQEDKQENLSRGARKAVVWGLVLVRAVLGCPLCPMLCSHWSC